ncbi:mitochondrial genome maintenance exonuclease 1-like isoform X2 [Gracilinanus agilis]|uniref:mitochondrial genome maintenance exonuclease 1-like isoform X2 n=1 Tax=Gracilinanus agilis TaxID=191870 RepID=UPI001CFD43EB|nr:mitochondrial genome maintenance exonuclease 1-like isoform X2 [Gracilinanus agilis]
MQSLSSMCKKLGRSSRLFVELAPSISFSTSCYFCSQKKKNNSYQEVDQNRYSNLIHSIVSTRISSQTPESLFQEDELLYGPVSKYGFAKYTSDIFLQGKHFHEVLEAMLSSPEQLKELDEKAISSGYVASVQHVLKDISGVRALESAVHHETLKYLGLMDCVAEYWGKLCVIDWKTSEKPKPFIWNTFDNPLQGVAYVGAINHDANYNFEVQCGLIVVAYKDGSPAHTHFMDSDLCSQYWSKWLL